MSDTIQLPQQREGELVPYRQFPLVFCKEKKRL